MIARYFQRGRWYYVKAYGRTPAEARARAQAEYGAILEGGRIFDRETEAMREGFTLGAILYPPRERPRFALRVAKGHPNRLD